MPNESYAPELDADDMGEFRFVDDVSCADCAHAPVCSIRQAVQGLSDEWEEREGVELPFAVEEMAVICQAYDPRDA